MPTTRGSSRTSWYAEIAILLAGAALILGGAPASAEVRFGNHVFIGGHDFSHQTYSRRHRAVITLYDRPIRNQGCVIRADGHGGTLKRCRLRRVSR